MPADFLLKSRAQPRPSVAPQPLPSGYEMRRIGEMVAADRAIAAGRNQMPNPAEVARQTQAMQAQQLARYQAQIAEAERAIAAGRNQTVNPAQVQQQTQAMQAQQLARYQATLDARDAALRPRPKPIGLPPGISPQPQVPSNQISQPVNRLPRPTTPTLAPQPRPISGVLSRAPRLPASIGTAGRGVAGALGGSAGALGSFGQIGYDGSNAGFDAAFPQLAPYRPGIQNAAALAGANPFGLQGLANHPLNPLNPFGKWWDWAPWNQGKTPNSLKPDSPRAEDHNMAQDADETVDFNPPANASAAPFRVTLSASQDNYGQTFADFLANRPVNKQSTTPISDERNLFGVLESIRVQNVGGKSGFRVYLKLRGEPEAVYFNYPGIGQPTATTAGTITTSKQLSVSGTPWPKTSPSDLSQLEPVPANPLEPDAPQQYEPVGRPEAPPHPTPQPSPQPLAQQVPRPSPMPRPGLRPQPAKDPTAQPNPTPQPDPDPQAPPVPDSNPGDSPWPWFDPDPFRNPFSPFHPANNPGIQPYRNTSTTTRPLRPDFPGVTPGLSTNSLDAPDILTDRFAQPQPEPLPKPAPEADLCKDPCIADMHDTSKGQKPKSISYKVFKKCGDNGPEFETKTLSVPSDQADALKILLDETADRKGEKCTLENNTLTIPEWWAVRPGADRPQFVILFGEIYSSGKLGRSRWSLSIPHYNRPQGAKPAIPKYRKGNWQATLTLTDNSKIRIHAASSTEAKKVMNKLKILVPAQYRTINGKAIKPTILEMSSSLKECDVVPIRGDFFKTGQAQNLPDWSVKFRT